MFGYGSRKFRCTDKSIIKDQEHTEDYNSAEPRGRIRYGKLGMYYRDLGKKYFVPYDYIDRAFMRASVCQPDDSPPIYYFRIILVHDGKEFANLIYEDEPLAFSTLDELFRINPKIEKGYIPPEKGKERARFC